jgi:hypothetical protein
VANSLGILSLLSLFLSSSVLSVSLASASISGSSIIGFPWSFVSSPISSSFGLTASSFYNGWMTTSPASIYRGTLIVPERPAY